MSALLASLLLTLGLGAYIFFPEKRVAAQAEKPRLELLEERKAVLYENLRDLNFEHRAGKYREEEYAAERGALETEAAAVLAEIDALERGAPRTTAGGLRQPGNQPGNQPGSQPRHQAANQAARSSRS